VGVALANLADAGAEQLALPFDTARRLDAAVDEVRDRFGSAAITRGVLIGRSPVISVPLLPD
jgi:DNA polymerase-4